MNHDVLSEALQLDRVMPKDVLRRVVLSQSAFDVLADLHLELSLQSRMNLEDGLKLRKGKLLDPEQVVELVDRFEEENLVLIVLLKVLSVRVPNDPLCEQELDRIVFDSSEVATVKHLGSKVLEYKLAHDLVIKFNRLSTYYLPFLDVVNSPQRLTLAQVVANIWLFIVQQKDQSLNK